MPETLDRATLIESLEQELALWRYLRIGLLLLGTLLIVLSFTLNNPPQPVTARAWPDREPAKAMNLQIQLPAHSSPLLFFGLFVIVATVQSWRGDRTKRALLLLLKAKDRE